jgi:4-hydroxyacetophenone monooxygenase
VYGGTVGQSSSLLNRGTILRNPHAGEPFDTSDEAITEALLDVSIPTLMLSLVHMTGRLDVIRGRLRPAGLNINEVQGYMSESDKAEARALALDVIREYRDAGCPDPRPLTGDEILEMMQWLACGPVSSDYVPMLIEEMELTGADGRRVEAKAPAELSAQFPVVVIGCGQSGLLAGIRLKEAGIPFTIVEKNAGVGGTWWENSYPGARVDTGNHFYCYSFEPSDRWSEFFSQQPELQAYFETVMNKHGIAPHVRWETEVLGAEWDDRAGSWTVRIVDKDGVESSLIARAVITAVGQLNRPLLPDIPGRDDFAGPAFHSARWDHSIDITDKRVAMIGAGASGFQIAPTIAPQVGHLTVFQRTAQWMFPNPNYHAKVGPGVQWALRHLPFYGRWYRYLILWPACDGGLEGARIDPDYPHPEVAVSERNELARQVFTQWITSHCEGDEELLAKVIPDYPATGKRTLQDNGSWLKTLRRDNVELIRTGIDHVEADAIVTDDGERHPVDIIVFATGFQMSKVLFPMTIIGRDGADLRALWGERPAAYLGITVPGFPNLFMTYGPGTHLAHGASLIFHSECQMRYISQCLDELITSGSVSMEPRTELYEEWHERTQREIKKMVWAQPTIKHSYFKNAYGEIHGVTPWRTVDYWAWTTTPNFDDFIVK